VVTGAQVVDIAINGRNYTSLLKTVPGIAADSGAGDVNVNGGRTAQNNFTLDGQNVTDIGVNQQFAYRISMDAIQEFKVSTNAQTAEFGRNDGAQIQVVTKSGSKDFHGDGYWYHGTVTIAAPPGSTNTATFTVTPTPPPLPQQGAIPLVSTVLNAASQSSGGIAPHSLRPEHRTRHAVEEHLRASENRGCMK
jgi:hypothetical protein